MTIRELKKRIADLPDDMPVAVDGYEDGITVQHVGAGVIDTVDEGPQPSYYGELFEATWSRPIKEGRKSGPRVFLLSRDGRE